MKTANVTIPEIAVVDDNQNVRDTLCELLILYGFEISITAPNGREFIDSLTETERLPDVCLIDLQMPVMDGFDTIKHIRERWSEIKIIACSIIADKERIDEVIQLGADFFYLKGSAPRILIEWIKAATSDRINST